jgi:hypothetical protein
LERSGGCPSLCPDTRSTRLAPSKPARMAHSQIGANIVAPKACTVVVHDLNDTAHQLDVTAETLYEAVAQALATVRGNEWVDDIGRGLTEVTVRVRNPEVTHIVKIQDFENWLNRGCKSPKETALKGRLRQMLGIGER